MTEQPFTHTKAYNNVKSNFIFHKNLSSFFKSNRKKGIINIGGRTQTIYDFAKKSNPKIKKKMSKGEFPLNMDMNLKKLKKLLKK